MIPAVASGKGGTGKTFPVQEKVFEIPARKCVAGITNDPEPASSLSPYPDMVLFDLEFKGTNTATSEVR